MAGASVLRPVCATAAVGGVPGRAERFPAHGTCWGCPGCDTTAPVDRGAARAHYLNGPSLGSRGEGAWVRGMSNRTVPPLSFDCFLMLDSREVVQMNCLVFSPVVCYSRQSSLTSLQALSHNTNNTATNLGIP